MTFPLHSRHCGRCMDTQALLDYINLCTSDFIVIRRYRGIRISARPNIRSPTRGTDNPYAHKMWARHFVFAHTTMADERTALLKGNGNAPRLSDTAPNGNGTTTRDDGNGHYGSTHKAHHNLAGLPAWRFRLACLSVWSATFLAAFDGTVVATLLSDIGSSFHAFHLASWLATAYLLSLCCFTPVYGRLADALGRRNAQLVALAFFTVGTALCAVAPTMNALIAARVLAGVGGGGLSSVGSILLSDLVDLRHRGLYQGYANLLYVRPLSEFADSRALVHRSADL